MANRFTDTDKWKDEWFLELEPIMKMLWIYILDTCDHAGVWKVNFRLASYCVGTALDKQSAMRALGGRVEVLSTEKWFIPKFITYQYGKKLNLKNNAHKGALKLLEFHNIETSPYLEATYSQETNPSDSLGDKEQEQEQEQDKVQGKDNCFNSSSEIFDPRKFLDSSKIVPCETSEVETSPKFTPDHFIDLWNGYFGDRLARATSLGGGKHRDNFIKALEFLPTEKHWRDLFNLCLNSPKVMGQNDIGWTISPTWIVDFDNAIKVLNGDFDDAKVVKNLFASMQKSEESA